MKDAGTLGERRPASFRTRITERNMSNHTIGGVIVPESVESWTCQIDGKLKHFYRKFDADSTAVWIHSSTGHRAPGCTPLQGDGFAGFMFTGDGERALVSISAMAVQRGKLTIVIDRYATQSEDIDPDYTTWAEVGQTYATWVRDWIRKNYGVKPVAQRAGWPSVNDSKETGVRGQTERRRSKVGNPGRASHAKAIRRLQANEDENAVRKDWRNDYADDTGLYPDETESGESELWRKNVKSKV